MQIHLDEIREKGFTIVRDAIEPELIDELQDDLDRIERDGKIGHCETDFEGQHTVRIYNLLVHGSAFQRVPVHSSVLPIVEGVLDSGCLISSLSSISIDPGETAQMIHADDQLMPIDKPHGALVCNTMWALTEFTVANGATRLVPESHLEDHSPDPVMHHESIGAEMTRGSVLVWHGSLWHGGGANQSNSRRVGIAMNYCAGFLRQQENQQLGVPQDLVASFEPRLQRLVGYGVYNRLIGHIDRHDPIELLGKDGTLKNVWQQ